MEEEQTGPKVMQFTFTSEKIMMHMNKQLLKKLRQFWENQEEGLDLKEFSELIMSRIHTNNDDEKYELIYGCYKLFQQVDINGDGSMDWGEFLQYIVDAVTGSGIQGGEDRDPVREQLIQLRAQSFKKFDRASRPLDKSNHKNIIQQSINCLSSKYIIAFERFGKELKFYDQTMSLEKKIELPFKKDAFIQYIAYDPVNMIYACTCTDSNMYFYKKGKVLIEFQKMIEAPCIQTRVWYMAKQKFWITAGRDFKVRHWSIVEKQGKLLQELYIRHTDDVTDCVEILNPLCIATCSLDQSIILYDVEHNEELTRITDYHEKGIRMLCYQKENGGNMISIGNETFANVWAPESLVSDMHNGRLQGHKKAIVDGKFLNNAPYFITIDITNLLMFWDINNKQCVQQIQSKFKTEINGIVVVKNNIFWVFGKRFFQFDTSMFEIHEKVDNDEKIDGDSYPVSAIMNEYMFQEIVVMKEEVRMYDMITGKLMSIYNNVFKEEFPTCEITMFKIDKRHRCAYVSNNKGRIYVINCQNGVILKNVTQFQEDQDNIKDHLNNSTEKYGEISDIGSSNYASDNEELNLYEDIKPKKKQKKTDQKDDCSDDYSVIQLDDPQINDMILIWETYKNDKEIIMMICSNQKEFYVYDESSPTESRLLRRIYGAHKEEITILAFDFHLSMIATGCVNGEIALFDFEMSRLEGILIGHTGDITAIEFIKPYPLMISASMDNTVCIWGVRPIATKLQNICLKRFENVSWDFKSMIPCPVSRMQVWCLQKTKGIKKFRNLKDKELLPAPTYRIFEHNWVFGIKSVEQIWEEEIAPNRLTIQGPASEEEKFQEALDSKLYQEILQDGKSNLFLTQGDRNEEYNNTLDEEKERIYLFLGDEQGFLKIWNLTDIIKDLKIKPCKNMTEVSTHAFNPFRQEKVDITGMAKTIRTTYPGQVMPLPINPAMTGILIRQAKAHMEVISSLQKIDLDDFKGFITCGKDNKVRNWNLELDLIGNINQNAEYDDPKWKFPSKQNEVKQIEEIQNIENLIDEMQDGKNRMGLQFERRTLKVDGSQNIVKVDDKIKTRANWFKIQEEQQKQKEEMLEAQIKLQRDIEFDNARNNLIINKISRTIAEQEIKMHQLKMNFPEKLQDGMFRDLQNQLNERQKALTEGLQQEIAEHEKNKLKVIPKYSSFNLKIKRRGTSTNLSLEKMISKKQSTRQLIQPNSPSKISILDESLSPLKFDKYESTQSRQELMVSIVMSQDTQMAQTMQTEKEKIQGMKEQMMKNLDAMKQYRAPTPKKRSITLTQMVNKSKFHCSPNQIFEESKNDRQNILALQNIPKLRKICNTLKTQDQSFKMNKSPEKSDKLNKRYIARMKDRKKSEAPPLPLQKKIAGMSFKTRPMSIADSEIQQINDFDGQLLINNNSQDQFDTLSLPQIRSGTYTGIQSQKNKQIKQSQIFNKQQFPHQYTQFGNTPQSFNQDSQERMSNASIDNILKQDHSRIISIQEENVYSTLKKDRSNMIRSDIKSKYIIDDIKLPPFSQIGHSIPKIISRNPLNSYNTAVNGTSNEAAIEYVLNKERKKKELLLKNYSQISPFEVPSTRHNTETNDMSHHRILRNQGQTPNQILKNNEPSKQQLSQKPSNQRILKYTSLIARSQKLEKNKSGSISPRDLAQSQKFQLIKEKYTGQTSYLVNEKKLNKDRLEQQRNAMAKLRKNYKTNISMQ